MTIPAQPLYTIPSTTGVEVRLRIAGPGARAFAFTVDWHIRTLAALAWYVCAAYSISGTLQVQAMQPSGWRFLFVVVCPAAIYFLYHPVLELLMRGCSPGKRMCGVRICDHSGALPGAGAIAIRNLFRVIDSFPFAYGVGLLATMLTREQVRIGDLAAGTLLVYDEADALKAPPA